MADKKQLDFPAGALGERLMEAMEAAQSYAEQYERNLAETPHPLVGLRVGRVMMVVEYEFDYADGDSGSIITYGAAKNCVRRYDQEMLLRQARRHLRRNYDV